MAAFAKIDVQGLGAEGPIPANDRLNAAQHQSLPEDGDPRPRAHVVYALNLSEPDRDRNVASSKSAIPTTTHGAGRSAEQRVFRPFGTCDPARGPHLTLLKPLQEQRHSAKSRRSRASSCLGVCGRVLDDLVVEPDRSRRRSEPSVCSTSTFSLPSATTSTSPTSWRTRMSLNRWNTSAGLPCWLSSWVLKIMDDVHSVATGSLAARAGR